MKPEKITAKAAQKLLSKTKRALLRAARELPNSDPNKVRVIKLIKTFTVKDLNREVI